MFYGLMDNYTQSILIFMGINIVAAYSFFAPFKTGQVSIGQAGFMAVGAYASAVFTQKFGLPFIVSVPLAALIAGVVGVVIGFRRCASRASTSCCSRSASRKLSRLSC
jgi:branched-chain amino acid transport system permease protein